MVAQTVVEEAGGRVPVAMGAQTTSTRELRQLAKTAQRLGCDFIQVSCPFYFTHTEDDFYEYVAAAAEAADIGIIVYNTFWTSAGISFGMVERLCDIPNVVGLKWATPRTDAMEFEDVVSHFSRAPDDHRQPPAVHHEPHDRRAGAFEVHLCNYWPEWGIKLLDACQRRRLCRGAAHDGR